jgi:hypothetical protein
VIASSSAAVARELDLIAVPSASNSGLRQGARVDGSIVVAIGAVGLLDRRFRQKMKKPSRIARKRMGIVTPITIFAPVLRELGCDGVGDAVTELVFDAVVARLGLDAGDTVLLAAAGNDKVGVKSSKISVSVLCHRTCTLYALMPSPEMRDTARSAVLPPSDTIPVRIPAAVKVVVHNSVDCHGNVESEGTTQI